MRDLIKADLGRLLKKRSIYTSLVITMLTAVGVSLLSDKSETPAYLESLRSIITVVSTLSFSISVILTVFGDEMRAGAVQCAIGLGLSRMKLILAKFLDCVIIMACQYTVLFLFICILNYLNGFIITDKNMSDLVLWHFLGLLSAGALTALSCFFLFLFWSTMAGVFADLFFIIFWDLLLKVVGNNTELTFLCNISHDAILERIYNNMSFSGSFDPGIFAIMIFYIALPLFAAWLVFRRKELEL